MLRRRRSPSCHGTMTAAARGRGRGAGRGAGYDDRDRRRDDDRRSFSCRSCSRRYESSAIYRPSSPLQELCLPCNRKAGAAFEIGEEVVGRTGSSGRPREGRAAPFGATLGTLAEIGVGGAVDEDEDKVRI